MKQIKVMNVVLSHQAADDFNRVAGWWLRMVEPSALLLLHTGPESEFAKIQHEQKLRTSDPRVRTRDHQREMQSYSGVFAVANEFCQERDVEYIHFAEYDHLPMVADLNRRQLERLEEEKADVMGFHLVRIEETNHPHYLYHLRNEQFHPYWRDISVRPDPNVILSMFGSGTFWKREAFAAIATAKEPFPMYLEIYLPTLAHHLGYRVRDFGKQDRFVHNLGDRSSEVERVRKAGGWTLHPVKKIVG